MKVNVKNISYKEYFELKDSTMYDYYLEYGEFEPEDTLNIGSFFDLTFGFVKDMQYYASEGLNWQVFFESVSEVTGKDIKELSDMSLFDLHKCRLYCIEEVKRINEIEVNNLGHQPSAAEERADISRFNSYGPFIQFDKLAGGNVLKFDKIKELKYDFCFTKLKLEADRDSYMEDYQRIISKKK
jgi:hypothetical protein